MKVYAWNFGNLCSLLPLASVDTALHVPLRSPPTSHSSRLETVPRKSSTDPTGWEYPIKW